jgi:hypothetical protein
MNSSKPPIVITSIFPPNKVVTDFVNKKFHIIVAGDSKTPEPWKYKNCEYLSLSDQKAQCPKLAAITPIKHYCRKNFAYLQAIQSGAEELFETDDDNFPQDNYPNFFQADSNLVEVVTSPSSFFNVYQEFVDGNSTLWPRGYPLKKILVTDEAKRKKKKVNVLIQQSLINNDTDVDAIYRLSVNKTVTFKDKKSLALDFHSYCPVNSQNTAWRRPAFLFLYLPSTVASRVCDILRGWVAQRLSWELDAHVVFLSPSVYQLRNDHDFLKDFEEEIPLYLHAEKIIEILEATPLVGSIEAKFISIYQALAEHGIVQQEEVARAKVWASVLTKIQ